MKSSRKFLALLMVVFAGLTTGKVLGQSCNPTFVQGSEVILPLCASAPCSTVVVSIQVANTTTCTSLGTTAPTWKVINNGVDNASGITIVSSSSSGSNPITHACTLQCKPTSAGGNAMKGRLTATWQGVCGNGAEIVRTINIFKSYAEANGSNNGRLDELSGAAGGANGLFRITAGSACVTPGTGYTFSVPALASNPATDEIGMDRYFWKFPSWEGQSGFAVNYYSGDSSAVTITAPSAVPSQSSVWIKVGKANTPNTPAAGNVHAVYLMDRNAFPIKVGSSQVNMTSGSPGWCRRTEGSGSFFKESAGYLSADQGGQSGAKIILSAQTSAGGDPDMPDANYTWTYPQNSFDLLSPDLNRRTIELRPRTGTNASLLNRITVSLNKGQCGYDAASFTLYRDFNTTGSPAYNRITPAPDATCYLPGRSYTFSITNAPAGNYTWAFTGGWLISSGQNTPTVTVIAGISSPTITVTAGIPPDATAGVCTGRSTTLTSSGYTVAGDGSLDIVIHRSGKNLSITKADGTDWLNFGCDASNFAYTWQFRGERSTTSSSTGFVPYGSWDANGGTWHPTINPSTGDVNNGSPIFTSPTTPNTASNTFASGWYRPLQTAGAPAEAQFRLTIRHHPNTPCTTYSCFFAERTYNLTTSQYRPGKGGGDNPSVKLEDNQLMMVNGLTVMPNPSQGQIDIDIERPAVGSVLIIKDVQGREVYRSEEVKTSQSLQLKHLPKGIYYVDYLGGSDRMGGRIVIE